MRWQVTVLLAVAACAATAFCATAGELAPGMSRADVVQLIGPPDAVRLERNGVVCLSYALNGRGLFERAFGARTRIVALKENRFFDDAVVRSDSVRFHCSRLAGRWDPPMRAPLVCDDRWGRGC
jgi:hypothetical protein